MNRFVILVFFASCQGVISVDPLPSEAVITEVEGSLTDGTAPTRTVVPTTGQLRGLSQLNGALAVSTDVAVMTAGSERLETMPVGAPGEEMSLGAVRLIARRNQSLWVHTDRGLFHEADGHLLRSPLSESISSLSVLGIDSFGEAESEELWLTCSQSLKRVAQGAMSDVTLAINGHILAAPSATLAVGPGQAVLVVGSDVFFVDVGAQKAAWVAQEVGTVNALARLEDGTAYLASSAGLYRRARSGTVEKIGFGGSIDALSVNFGNTLIATGGRLAQLDASGHAAVSIGTVTKPTSVTVDANGNTFVIDDATLVELATGTSSAPSFESDVKPFYAAHCTSCHTTGDEGSPVFDLTRYEVAKSKAASAVKRLQGQGGAPMPPASSEVLRPQEYEIVLRWFAGGMRP